VKTVKRKKKMRGLEFLEGNEHLPTREIIDDIEITEIEIGDLKKRLVKQKEHVKYISGQIKERRVFVEKLQLILKHREINERLS